MIDSSRSSLQKEAMPHFQPLTDSDLHVWCASLRGSADELSYYEALLSSQEKSRAERFYFERDRHRYIFGRGILRILLSSYLDIDASQIGIVYGAYGKPAIQNKLHHKTLQFNLAHSEGWALYAFAWDRPVGIDLEHIRPMQDVDDFATRFFSTREGALINSLSNEQKWRTFFKIWTCKEAFLKAKGSGLAMPLDQTEISFDVNGCANLMFLSGEVEQSNQWRLEMFVPMVDYQAALAIQGYKGRVLFQML